MNTDQLSPSLRAHFSWNFAEDLLGDFVSSGRTDKAKKLVRFVMFVATALNTYKLRSVMEDWIK